MLSRLWPVVGILALVLSGCAGNDILVRKQVEMEGNLERLIQDESSLKTQIAKLSEEVKDLETQVKAAAGDPDVFRQFKSSMNEMQHRLSEVSKGLQQVQQAQQAAELQKAPQLPQAGHPSDAAAGAAKPAESAVPPASQPKAAETRPTQFKAPGKRATGKEAYAHAFALFNAGNYTGAADAFESFVKAEPTSEFAPNAFYWSGECYYTQHKYQRALEAFNKVLADYPKAHKVPDAMLKIGFTQISMKETAKAKATLKFLIEKYPRTPAATKAKERLAHL